MELNRRGANRWVLLTRRWAFKVPRPTGWRHFLYGLLNNLNEARDGSLPGRCPVVWACPGGWVIVMPRVRVLGEEEFAAWDYMGFVTRNGIRAERKADSFGELGGVIVVVDYGW